MIPERLKAWVALRMAEVQIDASDWLKQLVADWYAAAMLPYTDVQSKRTQNLRYVSREHGIRGEQLSKVFKRPTARAIMGQLAEVIRADVALKQDEVHKLLRDVLELCPTDFCQPGINGGWLIDAAIFDAIPRSIKRLIEKVEYKRVNGNWLLHVEFISKTSVLAMACKHILGQKIDATVRVQQLDWDKVVDDPIEQRIAAEYQNNELGGTSGPVRDAEGAVAPRPLLPPATGNNHVGTGQH